MPKGNSEFRRKQKAMRRVQEIQRGQKGEDTLWEDVQSTNRHERRRFKKAERKFDKINGEGEAQRRLREAVEAEPDHFIQAFVAQGNGRAANSLRDRDDAEGSASSDIGGGVRDQRDAHASTAQSAADGGRGQQAEER